MVREATRLAVAKYVVSYILRRRIAPGVANTIRSRSDASAEAVAASVMLSYLTTSVTQPNLEGVLEDAVPGPPSGGPSMMATTTGMAACVGYRPTSGDGKSLATWVSLGMAEDVTLGSPFVELSAEHQKAWLYCDIVRRRLEVKGTQVWQGGP